MRRPVIRWYEPRPTPVRSTGHSRLWRCARERRDVAAPSTWACDPVHPTLPGSSSALVGTLHDPLAFVITQSQVSILARIGRILPDSFA